MKKKAPGLAELLKSFIEEEYTDLEVDVWEIETGYSPEQIRINLINPLTTLVIIYPASNDVYRITVRETSNEPWALDKLNPGDPQYIPLLKQTIAIARANRMKWHDMVDPSYLQRHNRR
jgi:hypothetical protein